jgi:hypothetical protein
LWAAQEPGDGGGELRGAGGVHQVADGNRDQLAVGDQRRHLGEPVLVDVARRAAGDDERRRGDQPERFAPQRRRIPEFCAKRGHVPVELQPRGPGGPGERARRQRPRRRGLLEDEAAHAIRMPGRELVGGGASRRVPDEVRRP